MSGQNLSQGLSSPTSGPHLTMIQEEQPRSGSGLCCLGWPATCGSSWGAVQWEPAWLWGFGDCRAKRLAPRTRQLLGTGCLWPSMIQGYHIHHGLLDAKGHEGELTTTMLKTRPVARLLRSYLTRKMNTVLTQVCSTRQLEKVN